MSAATLPTSQDPPSPAPPPSLHHTWGQNPLWVALAALAGDAWGRIGSWQSGEGWKPREVVTKTEPEMHSHRERLQGVASFILAPSVTHAGASTKDVGHKGLMRVPPKRPVVQWAMEGLWFLPDSGVWGWVDPVTERPGVRKTWV